MRIVVQCAGTKQPDGFFKTPGGRPVKFVAHPELVPPEQANGLIFARPDDVASDGRTWRQHVIAYNDARGNPYGLWRAGELYEPAAYGQVVRSFGLENIFILSAGWGLIRSSFLTPQYDITFSAQADAYKRRRRADHFEDFRHVDQENLEPMVFLGGKDYLPLFCSMTSQVRASRIVFYNSFSPPDAPGCQLVRFETTRKTNWHYECAAGLVSGSVRLP